MFFGTTCRYTNKINEMIKLLLVLFVYILFGNVISFKVTLLFCHFLKLNLKLKKSFKDKKNLCLRFSFLFYRIFLQGL